MLLYFQLVAGSGANEEVEEKEVGPGVVEVDVHHDHEHGHDGEGIPGPITRLLVIANRGIANLVQDLILVSIDLLTFLSSNGFVVKT
nr:unnamed protein product [Callosobruchus analis]